jgi:ParB-like chromosome segregation protein Spo0J
VVREGGNAVEDSYAENIQRVALHPLDQFRAFKDRREAGLGEEEIAARFMVSVAVVRQRLRLASVSGDPARQEQVWEMIGSGHYAQPHQIRRLLTEDSVPATDRRAKFIANDVAREREDSLSKTQRAAFPFVRCADWWTASEPSLAALSSDVNQSLGASGAGTSPPRAIAIVRAL